MIEIKRQDLINKIEALGYKIDQSGSFNYTNNLNPGPPYKARHISLVEADTGISAFHYKDARRDDNFKALQELRFNEEYLVNGRVWEI